jgi:cbb3-type cytochrome c oxidase subunit III
MRFFPIALLALGVWICGAMMNPAPAQPAAPEPSAPAHEEEEEEGPEFLARSEELAAIGVNDIAKSLRLNARAMKLGRSVYETHCASCHGADLKGLPDKHTPDLTDAEWRFSGDDYESGGLIKLPSDVEWTVRYGIRSGHANARGIEGTMLAFNPTFRNEEDTKDHGTTEYLKAAEIDDVAEYVLQLGGQRANRAKAARGKTLFYDNTKGNCPDCHDMAGTGLDTIGSTNLTKPRLYLYGSDRASIIESITKGRHGTMPAFEDVLKPEEIKAVSIFAFSNAAKPRAAQGRGRQNAAQGGKRR